MNQELNQEYWEARYQSADMPWEKGAASPGLVDFLAAHPELPRGTVCVSGCGTGHDVRAFAAAGFETFGFDIAPSGIRLAEEKTKAAGLTATFQLADFLRDEPPQKFDWLFEHTLFCAIQPDERDDYVRAVLRWLKPGVGPRPPGIARSTIDADDPASRRRTSSSSSQRAIEPTK